MDKAENQTFYSRVQHKLKRGISFKQKKDKIIELVGESIMD